MSARLKTVLDVLETTAIVITITVTAARKIASVLDAPSETSR